VGAQDHAGSGCGADRGQILTGGGSIDLNDIESLGAKALLESTREGRGTIAGHRIRLPAQER